MNLNSFYGLDKVRKDKNIFQTFSSKTEMNNYLLSLGIITLDEFGIPLPLAQKLELQLNSKDGVDEILEKLRQLDLTKIKLSSFEIELVQNTLSSV